MSSLPSLSFRKPEEDRDDSSCARSIASAPATSQTDFTSPPQSPRHFYSSDEMATSPSDDPTGTHETRRTDEGTVYAPHKYDGLDSEAGGTDQSVAQQSSHQNKSYDMQAPTAQYVDEQAAQMVGDNLTRASLDAHTVDVAQRQYPDTESIRHLHTLFRLLPHIEPSRKLNALSGPTLDIIADRPTGTTFCYAVPKKLLVLFLGRAVVNRHLRTLEREDNENWNGLPTKQAFLVPSSIVSASAMTILVSWMTRACTQRLMANMRAVSVPSNLLAACSLAQTMDYLGLKRDAYRVDTEIKHAFDSNRPLYVNEVEAIWRGLGENSRYVYAAVKAYSTKLGWPGQRSAHTYDRDLLGLGERCPQLWARIYDAQKNEAFKVRYGGQWFGREWFSHIGSGGDVASRDEKEGSDIDATAGSGDSARLYPHPQPTTSAQRRPVRALDPEAAPFIPTRGLDASQP
ncbi:hypothetical protein E8E13_007613 [Curvularia kusanoi]|uniref:Uncharacterized protein n=1 Tax=Curvularia kusanoi TaxID=90978 RepID=A0A9P4TBZ3_CURKU|nr:hypothetical protein E8E13_007613 [Curvularia kusanoi]